MDGWKMKTLGDVCILRNGRAYKKVELLDSGKYPVLRVGNFFTNRHWYYSNLELDDTKYCDTGDLLYAWSASFGPRIWDGTKAIYHYHIWRVDYDISKIAKQFLFYWFEWDAEGIKKDQGAGTTMVHVSKKSMNARPISLPPISQQKQIVTILDEAFAAIATATANAEKNLANARELFESELNGVFAQKGDGWIEKTLGEVCSFQGGSQPPKSEFSQELKDGYVRLIQIRDYKTNKHIVYIPTRKARRFCSADDVMIGRYGPPLFQILRGIEGAYNVALMKAEPKEELIRKDYLYYFLKNGSILRYIIGASNRAAGQIGLNKATLEPYPIAFPSKTKQAEIVLRLESIQKKIQRLENIFQHKLTALAELKQSLLHKAFTGELTAGNAVSVSIPFPAMVENITTTDLHAGILAIAYRMHEKKNRLKNFGHVKGEKIAHMIEACAGIDLDRNPVKDAAGPNDYPHLKKVEHRARLAGFFSVRRRKERYELSPSGKFDDLINRVRGALGDHLQDVEKLIQLMLSMDTRQSEIFATVYAAWNNLLLDGLQPTDEEIVFEARENWHSDKLKINREKFFKAIDWIRKKHLVPTGKGKRVNKRVA